MPGDLSLAFLAGFLYNQLFGQLPAPTTSFAGKTVIVTGSNVGLGLEAARHIARLGAAKLILAVRSTEKGEAAKKSIEETTNCGPDVIEVWPLDLCSYASVKAFAARATRDLARLDVLLENAGVVTTKWNVAEDNELTITVNVVSTFLLAFSLLPKLKETAAKFNTRPVLTIVSSEVHFFVDFQERDAPEGIFNHLNNKANAKKNNAGRYEVSKLLEVFVVREMAARRPTETYPVTINTVNPGLCQSELSREGGLAVSILKFLLARSTEKGSRTLVHAAGAGAETHGQYLDMCRVSETATLVRSKDGEQAQHRVWGELVEKLEKIQPGVTGNL